MLGEGAIKQSWPRLLKVCIKQEMRTGKFFGLGAVDCRRNRAEHSDRARKIHKRQKLMFERR